MVDEARQVAALGGVDDGVEVDAEEVGAADAGGLVVRLAHVRHHGPHHLPHVLDHHLVRRYRLLSHTHNIYLLAWYVDKLTSFYISLIYYRLNNLKNTFIIMTIQTCKK